jgi:hypothetical protein
MVDLVAVMVVLGRELEAAPEERRLWPPRSEKKAVPKVGGCAL